MKNKIFLYNTLTRKREEFIPQKNKEASFYYCGPTVYWIQHIGNLRGSVCADLVRRTLEYNDYKVKMVRNYTDVGHLTSDGDEGEDKMEKAAQRDKLAPVEIAQKYIDIYENDTCQLNILKPWKSPKATEHIKDIQKMIKTLLEKGYAYETKLAIYFDISKAQNYTKLSGQILENNLEGAGRGYVEDVDKKNSQDFAIWFFKAGTHKNALQTWEFKGHGKGFPGWHIECSAMSKKYLGDTIDIHMGGIEHVPVHHTNEIAQSEAVTGKKFVNYWLHNEHLLVDNKKMAKSEGTGFSLAQIEEKGFTPSSLRYFFLSAHYASKQNFTWDALEASQNGLKGLYNKIRLLGKDIGKVNEEYKEKFLNILNDDINTSGALAVLQEVLKSDLEDEDKLATILDFDNVLGLNFFEEVNRKEIIPNEVIELIEKRKKARNEKNWKESDKLRDEINNLGWKVEDGNEMRVYKK